MGSYQVFKAERSPPNFQVSLFANSTGTTRSIAYFSHYLYQSALQTVDPEIEFETEMVPFPVFHTI